MHAINTHICGKHLDAYVISHKFVSLSIILWYLKWKKQNEKEKQTAYSLFHLFGSVMAFENETK